MPSLEEYPKTVIHWDILKSELTDHMGRGERGKKRDTPQTL